LEGFREVKVDKRQNEMHPVFFTLTFFFYQNSNKMTKNESLIRQFYQAFEAKDLRLMTACYSTDLVFNDPVYKGLNYAETCKMWEIVRGFGQDLTIEIKHIQVGETTGNVIWQPSYIFYTGKKVVHQVRTSFEIKDDKIIRHTDNFDLHNWSKQAFGIIGVWIGGTTFFRKIIQKLASNDLKKR
jgi:limonene-1,2-epoxide hydrolase